MLERAKTDGQKRRPKGKGRGTSTAKSDRSVADGPGDRPKGSIPCRYHSKGGCQKGDNCPYKHGESAKASAAVSTGNADVGAKLNAKVSNAEPTCG